LKKFLEKKLKIEKILKKIILKKMRFFRQFWKKKIRKNKKSVFGGNVKSQKEIAELNKKIRDHEKKEFSEFEKKFDDELENL